MATLYIERFASNMFEYEQGSREVNVVRFSVTCDDRQVEKDRPVSVSPVIPKVGTLTGVMPVPRP